MVANYENRKIRNYILYGSNSSPGEGLLISRSNVIQTSGMIFIAFSARCDQDLKFPKRKGENQEEGNTSGLLSPLTALLPGRIEGSGGAIWARP